MHGFNASPTPFCEADSPYLFSTNRGAIFQCSCCRRLQLMFDDIVLVLSPRDFRCLSDAVETAMQQIDDAVPSWWRLSAPGRSPKSGVRVHSDDIAALRDLLQGTAAMLELDGLLADTLGMSESLD
ncbi:hypothetical protein [Longimonas halophila]|nr:hypothetical protein [Longimonas halophila]